MRPEPKIVRPTPVPVGSIRTEPVETFRAPRSTLPPIWVTYDAEWRIWWVREDYPLPEWGLTIPAGFATDLASIPRIAWPIIAPFELSLIGPVTHDLLYRTGGDGGRFSRLEADRLFHHLMVREGVPDWRRDLAYAAVRAFGGGAWRAA